MIVQKLDAAATDEWNHSVTEILDFLDVGISVAFRHNPGVARLDIVAFVQAFQSELNWPAEKVRDLLQLLSMRPRPNFLEPTPPLRKEDVFPWRFNRSLSYLRRPFIFVPNGSSVDVVWGPRHLSVARDYLLNLCIGGRLKAQHRNMQRFISDLQNEQGQEFNDRVADFLAGQRAFTVLRRVKTLGRLRGSAGPPGDIDVLAINVKEHILYVIECKALAVARTPPELSNELQNLIHGQHGRRSVTEKHQARTKWVANNFREILQSLEIKPRGNWQIQPLIVVDSELMTPHLTKLPIPVVSIDRLHTVLKLERR